MPLGIRPINDFAFKKTFGTAENRVALISLLNAILKPNSPIVEVTLENPFNLQDFEDDKLSILDIKAVDGAGAIYDIEMQLAIFAGLVQRIVFYGCELYAGQLKAGDDYAGLHPVYSICLVNGILWPEATRVHHAFRLADAESGRVLQGTLEIHTLELGRYTLKEAELAADRHAGLLAVLALARPRVRARGTAGVAAAASDPASDGNARQDCTNQRGQSDVRRTRESDSRPEMGIELRLSRR